MFEIKKPIVKLVTISEHPLETVKWAADVSRIRIGDDPVSYCERQGFSQEDLEDYFVNMIQEQFATPLEYVNTVWYLDNVSRAAQQQITRHRQASYSIESMRVVDKKNFATEGLYCVPERIAKDQDKLREFTSAMLKIEESYNLLISEGVEVEDARGILPLNIFSTITMSMNLRSVIHLILARCCYKAQGEVHEIAEMMVKELEPFLGKRVVDKLSRPCKLLNKCFMRLENEQALAGTTTRPLCPLYKNLLERQEESLKNHLRH